MKEDAHISNRLIRLEKIRPTLQGLDSPRGTLGEVLLIPAASAAQAEWVIVRLSSTTRTVVPLFDPELFDLGREPWNQTPIYVRSEPRFVVPGVEVIINIETLASARRIDEVPTRTLTKSTAPSTRRWRDNPDLVAWKLALQIDVARIAWTATPHIQWRSWRPARIVGALSVAALCLSFLVIQPNNSDLDMFRFRDGSTFGVRLFLPTKGTVCQPIALEYKPCTPVSGSAQLSVYVDKSEEIWVIPSHRTQVAGKLQRIPLNSFEQWIDIATIDIPKSASELWVVSSSRKLSESDVRDALHDDNIESIHGAYAHRFVLTSDR